MSSFCRLYLFLILCSAVLFTSCGYSGTNNASKKEKKETKTQAVEVVKPEKRSFHAEILITGTAQPNQMVLVYAMESGILKKISKDIGDKVRKGELIAVLENPELIQTKMKLQAEHSVKKASYDRLKSIFDETPALTTIQSLETAEGEYLASKANLDAVKSRLNFLTIKAPFSGTITNRFVDLGALIQNGLTESNPQAIVEIQEVNPIRLTLAVPESDAVSLSKGQEVEVVFPELSGNIYKSTISRLSHVLDEKSKTMQVEIDMKNTKGEILTGMYAKVFLQIESKENILSLPVSSKIRYKNEDYILVVEKKKVKRVLLKMGLSDKYYFEVLNTEINDETIVVLKGKGLVSPGQEVNPIMNK